MSPPPVESLNLEQFLGLSERKRIQRTQAGGNQVERADCIACLKWRALPQTVLRESRLYCVPQMAGIAARNTEQTVLRASNGGHCIDCIACLKWRALPQALPV